MQCHNIQVPPSAIGFAATCGIGEEQEELFFINTSENRKAYFLAFN